MQACCRGELPCYRCLFPEPPPPEFAPNCAEASVLVLPGVIGLLQAAEVVKLLLGIGDSLAERLLQFDALSMRFRETRLRHDPDCAVCAVGRPFPGYIDYAAFCRADWSVQRAHSQALAELAGRDAGVALERRAQVAVAGEAAGEGDAGDVLVAVEQVPARTSQALRQDVLRRRGAEGAPERDRSGCTLSRPGSVARSASAMRWARALSIWSAQSPRDARCERGRHRREGREPMAAWCWSRSSCRRSAIMADRSSILLAEARPRRATL